MGRIYGHSPRFPSEFITSRNKYIYKVTPVSSICCRHNKIILLPEPLLVGIFMLRAYIKYPFFNINLPRRGEKNDQFIGILTY